jgi:hypothetical protein
MLGNTLVIDRCSCVLMRQPSEFMGHCETERWLASLAATRHSFAGSSQSEPQLDVASFRFHEMSRLMTMTPSCSDWCATVPSSGRLPRGSWALLNGMQLF